MLLNKQVAACVHVYYEDGWDQIADYLTNLPAGADIFVTCREEIEPSLRARVRARFEHAEVVVMPNIGMDVLPFLLLCQERRLYEYAAVLKLHTKNTKTSLRADQGRIMFDGLCGSAGLVTDIIDRFHTDRDAGMLGTAFQMRSANALMYGNRPRMKVLLEQLEIELTDWPFFTGTMFWIAGPLLRSISRIAPDLLEQARDETQGQTGGDGTLAHTLERAFGALAKAAARNFYLTERADADSGTYLVLPLRLHGPANHWRFLEADSTEFLRRHVEATHWCKSIRVSALFDEAFYTKNLHGFDIPGMDPAYHFVLYGDLFELDPGPDFDTTYYQLRRTDVARQNICSLAHFLHVGHREGTSAVPNEEDWFDLAERLGLFDGGRYSATYPDVAFTGMSPKEHYRLIGRRLGRAGSIKFAPQKVPVLAQKMDAPGAELETFLKNYFLDEQRLYQVLARAGRNGDFAFVRSFSKRLRDDYGSTRALNEAMGASHLFNAEWEKAKECWQAYWDETLLSDDSSRHGGSGLAFDRPSKPLEGFHTVTPKDLSGQLADPLAGTHARICVYTTLFGDIDDLIPVLKDVPGVDFLCFTDRPRDALGWKQIVIDSDQTDNNLKAKVFKILPHKHLQDYTHSLFVDANTVLLGRIGELIGLCLLSGDFAMWQHPLRDDAYTEVNTIIAHRRHEPTAVIDQISHYFDKGFPRDTGMFEASFIWRKHGEPSVVALMEQWWDEICQFSKRDQISLSYLVWKTGKRPHLLSPELGTSRDNIFFFKAPHRNGKVRASQHTGDALESPLVATRNRDITFLYSEAHTATGSTVLRGQQLSGLVRDHYGAKRAVHYTSDPDLSDQTLVLTKGFLKTTNAEQLRALRQRNLLIADFVDEPPGPGLIAEIDVLMASSLMGYKGYMTTFPDVPAFHVTHHVDTRIPRSEETADDRLRAGYFGELVNTIQSPELDDLIAFNLVDTSKQTHAWIDQLADYNFHYAFRRTRGIDGAKPFLKGFVAAHCGANMMIQSAAGDASFYLGSDYPYLMPDDASVEDIVDALKNIRDSVGGQEWRYGREIMRDVAARSSVEHVMKEFDDMVSALEA